MKGNELLKKYIQENKLSVGEVAKIAGLSQSTVSMHLATGKHKRGIGGQSAMAYNKAFGLPIEKLLQR
jgi:DNA-binding CsgD family transcriptional regulator